MQAGGWSRLALLPSLHRSNGDSFLSCLMEGRAGLGLTCSNSSESLKIIHEQCLAPTENIAVELLPAPGRVTTAVFLDSVHLKDLTQSLPTPLSKDHVPLATSTRFSVI